MLETLEDKAPPFIVGAGIGTFGGFVVENIINADAYHYDDQIADLAKQNHHLRAATQLAVTNHINSSALSVTNHKIANNTREIHQLQAHYPDTFFTDGPVRIGIIATTAVIGAAIANKLFRP